MKPVEIQPDIFWIGVNDTTTRLFEGLWPIEKEGISYNSYLIRDEKTILVDICKDFLSASYLERLQEVVDPQKIDAIILNHLEPDHSGAIRALHQAAPQAHLITSAKGAKMLADFFGISDPIQVVGDGEVLSTGKHALQFIMAPMVHWPETMMTYETTTGTLFSCDAFGGYGKLEGGIFDGDHADLTFYETESLRYFANIVAAFSKPVLNAAAKLAGLDVRTIAPSHGLVWRKDPGRILNLYLKWSNYSTGQAEKGITLLHGSMYGNTARMTAAIIAELKSAGIPYASHDVTTEHISYILPSLWVNQGVLIGAPTSEGSLFPTMALMLQMAEIKRVSHKQAGYYGSYGWGGGAVRHLNHAFEALKWTLVDTLDFAGQPEPDDLQQCGSLVRHVWEHINQA